MEKGLEDAQPPPHASLVCEKFVADAAAKPPNLSSFEEALFNPSGGDGR